MAELARNKKERSFWESLLFLLIPPHCAACGEAGYELLCPSCREELRAAFAPRRFLCYGGNGFADEEIALFSYDSAALKSLLFQWKRQELGVFATLFRPYFARRALRRLLPKEIDVVTFLPRRRRDRRRYGLDQAERLAALFAEGEGLPMETLLKRCGVSRPQQKSLPAEKRHANVAGAFEAVRELHGETVLLVDDIVTTGSSVWEGARMLKQAGAMRVIVLCLAH